MVKIYGMQHSVYVPTLVALYSFSGWIFSHVHKRAQMFLARVLERGVSLSLSHSRDLFKKFQVAVTKQLSVIFASRKFARNTYLVVLMI